MVPNIHLFSFPGYSCGFLRAGRFNGKGMSWPVSITLTTVLGKLYSLTQAQPRGSSVVCRAWWSIRGCFSVLWVPAHIPCPALSVPQSPLLLPWMSLTPCRPAALSSLPLEQRPGTAPHPLRSHGPAASSTHRSLFPLSQAAKGQGPVGWDKAPKVLSPADRGCRAEEAASPWGLLDSYRAGNCWQTNLQLYPHSLFMSWAFLQTLSPISSRVWMNCYFLAKFSEQRT